MFINIFYVTDFFVQSVNESWHCNVVRSTEDGAGRFMERSCPCSLCIYYNNDTLNSTEYNVVELETNGFTLAENNKMFIIIVTSSDRWTDICKNISFEFSQK